MTSQTLVKKKTPNISTIERFESKMLIDLFWMVRPSAIRHQTCYTRAVVDLKWSEVLDKHAR